MAFATLIPGYQPSVGSGTSWTARLIENQFGDGYRQTAPDGLNAVVGQITLTWDMLPYIPATGIDGFFRQQVGKPFYFTLPNAATYLWECKTWTRENVSGPYDKITATLTQRFDLG